jgi:murein tripeptide amidase MpaA
MYCLDNTEWQRAEDTAVVAESLVFSLPCLTVSGQRGQSAHVAYFVPFNYETQHTELIARCLQSPHVTQKCAALSVQQREVSLLTITDHSSKAKKVVIWIVCRQHPAETMAEWWAEGFLQRLLDQSCTDDPQRDALLRCAEINIIPCANPDGAVLGLTRTNAAGMNLNREWASPSPVDTPELVGILSHISSCDFVLDVHGDENVPRPVCAAPLHGHLG